MKTPSTSSAQTAMPAPGRTAAAASAPGRGAPVAFGSARPAPDRPPAHLVPRRYKTVRGAEQSRRRTAARLAPLLDGLLASRNPAADVRHDPIFFVHRYADPADQEVAGLLAAALAYGQVPVILGSVRRVLDTLGPHPAQAVVETGGARLAERLDGFVHRWTRGPDVAALAFAAGRILEAHGRLGALFEAAFAETGGELREALGRFVDALTGADFSPVHGRRAPPPGLAYLLPDGRAGGACKRVHMYLRWMVRGPDAVDRGLWRVPTSALLVPLDTHTSRISRYLGLTDRKDASWKTAEEVTWRLRALDPDDPVKYDFALAHLGISGACRHRRVESVCGRCDLRSACRM